MKNRNNAANDNAHNDNKGNKGNPPSADRKNPARRYIFWALGIAALFLVSYFFLYVGITPKKPLTNFFTILKEQGYEPNIGFSGNFVPGNIIQIKEKRTDGKEHRLYPPLVVLWKEDCFPGKVLRESLYVLPQSSGENAAQLNFGAEIIGTMMPVLQVDTTVASDYNMKLENTRIRSFAKLELSQQFSEQCVRTLENELHLGKDASWYAVILEAIVVDAIIFEINWRDNSTAAARNKVKKDTEKTLGSIIKQDRSSGQTFQGSVNLASDSKQNTIIKAVGQVIVGYRARQLEPIFNR